tara:strand:- start:1334 stop:1951 length:618 start_codon:yes stop_codon:yes gene_type:complete
MSSSITSSSVMSPRASILVKKDDDENTLWMCCLTSSICLFGITYIGALITWWIFAIIALVKYNNNYFNSKCQDSNLWIILLLWVILTGWSLFLAKKESNKQDKQNKMPITAIVCGLLPSLAILGWTGASLFNPCVINHFESNRIYLLVQVMFYLVSSIMVLIIIGSLCLCIYGCCAISKNTSDNNLDQINPTPSVLMEEKLTDTV